jgi:anti-sigma factor RsiW
VTSGHEHERLSAYLDGELAPAERARVAAHLEACAECTARLAELAAANEAMASLPSEAPQGYFESLPARVRARLEPRAVGRRLPVWTWAAAAALLLAVVTPLTLLRQPDARSSLPAGEIPAAAPPALATSQAPPAVPAPEAARADREAETKAQRRAPVSASPVPKKRESAFASAPSEADARAPRAQEPWAPAAARADEGATPEALAPEARNLEKARADRQAAERPRDATAEAAAAETMVARGRVGGPGAAAVAAPTLVATEDEWRRLDATRPHTPAEWRRLREEWRRFVARDPDGPLADEARVRAIETGLSAWRSGGDPADEVVFRRDAASYLERNDAAQKQRVERLVAEAGRP